MTKVEKIIYLYLNPNVPNIHHSLVDIEDKDNEWSRFILARVAVTQRPHKER